MRAFLIGVPVVSAIVISASFGSLAMLRHVQAPLPNTPVTVTVSDPVIRVAVLNGCGREGLATLFADRIRGLGFDVINGQGGNASFFDYDRSVVLERKGDPRKARQVANALGIGTIVKQFAANPYILEDVTVILGRDWDTLTVAKEEKTE